MRAAFFPVFLLILLLTAPSAAQAQNDTLSHLVPFTEASLRQNVYVMILDVGKNDLLYPKRHEFIGQTGLVAVSRLLHMQGEYFRGAIKLDNGKKRFFEEVKIAEYVPPEKKQPVRLPEGAIAVGEKVVIESIAEDDLYYPNSANIVGHLGTVTSALLPAGNGFYSGEIRLDNGYLCRFFRVKVTASR